MTLGLLVLPAAAWAQTDAGTYRATSELNIRSLPAVEGELVGVIPPDGRVTVSRCDTFGWCRIRYQDIEGWAARQFLVRTGDLPPDAFALRFAAPAAAAAGDTVELTGRLTIASPCPVVRTDDGVEYALVGNFRFNPADAIHVLAELVPTDACGTLTALAVLAVRPAW